MKWITRFITIVMLLGALVVPFFIKNKQGQPMLSLPTVDDLKPDLGKDIDILSGERVFYKWKDENGVWQFGDERPEGVTNVMPVSVNVNANIMQSLPKEKVESSGLAVPGKVFPPGAEYTPPSSADDTLTLDRALNIVEDAHAVRKMMEARNQAIDGHGGQ